MVLQSQVGNTFDGFMDGASMYSSRKETFSAMVFHGVSEKCNKTLRSLNTDERWQYFDSWGKPGSGILSGNVKWFGAFDQCIGIPDAKYCLVNVLGKFRTNKTFPIWCGICIPDACNNSDVSTVVENFVENVTRRYFPSIRVVDLSCYEEPSYTTSVVFTIILCCIILACCAVGTAIEISQESFQNGKEDDYFAAQNGALKHEKDQGESSFSHEIPKVTDVMETTPLLRANKKQNGVTDSLELEPGQEKDPKPTAEDAINNTQQLKSNGLLVEFFLCFSLLRNTRDVLKTDVAPGTVTSLYGLRVMSIFWIILGHVYAFSAIDGNVENIFVLLGKVENFSMTVISNTYPAVDTFFFLSGLLLMYNVMKILKNNNGEIHWGKLYLHRFLRLTPTMMFVILFVVQLEPFVDKGPLWQRHVDEQKCDNYWWTNLLYISNFYPTNFLVDGCLLWTWYLSVDMQFFVITPVIIYLCYRYGYRGVFGTSVFLGTASIICIAVITKHYDIHSMANSMPRASPSSKMEEFNYLYIKPYCRIHPYLVGLVVGYFMHKRAFRAKQLNWPFAVIFWFIAAAVALSVIYGPFTALREDPRPWTMTEKILYNTTRHLAWGIILAWVTYACEYGYGGYVQEFLSARFWIPLGRLTYSTYLVHCALLNVMYFGYRSGLLFSTQWWAYIYCGALLLSHGIAFILVITIEYPCANLEKLLFRKNRKDQK
ncbi:nose resistant to fluoxetine 6-like [Paramuricea clavata]|nr:nose resistant to fluoxetine 6-like [Paramuricea clavata]